MNFVIIGNGPAAIAAAEAIRQRDAVSPLTLISAENEDFYSPCPLAEYVEDSVPRERLFLRDADFYHRLNITLLRGRPVTAINSVHCCLTVGSGEEAGRVDYDRLLVACGAKAVLPAIPGLAGTPGVWPLKTLADADAIVARLPHAKRAVVIGSGFIGLEAAQALQRRGLAVTVVEAREQVLPHMLDADLAQKTAQRLTAHGLRLRLNAPAQAVLGGAQGVRAVLAGNEELPCDLVVCAAGVAPDGRLFAGSGIALDKGVLVNDYMETNLPDVFAAGDVAQAPDHLGRQRLIPIWPNAVSTGQVAGANMVAPRSRRHRGLDTLNVVRIFHLPVASFGQWQLDPGKPSSQMLTTVRGEAVRKLHIADGRIVGGQFYGDVNGAGIYLEMMHKGVEVAQHLGALCQPDFGYGQLLPPPPRAKRAA